MTTKTGIELIQISDATFQMWLDTTNEVVDLVNENVMLAAPGAGFTTIGNSTLQGTFTANTVTATSASATSLSVETIGHAIDPDSNIVINSPVRISSPSNLENMLEIKTNTGERPIVGLINGANGRWDLSLETSAAGSAFNISTPGASTPQLRVLQNGTAIAAQFEGIGTNLTNLNAANVTTGILSSDVMPFLIEKFITFRRAGGTRFDRALDQDGVLIRGRNGGTSGYSVTVTPGVLTGNRVLTLANGDTVLVAGTMVPTSRTITAQNGITGGGNLEANRTIELGGQARAFHDLSSNGIVTRTALGAVTSRTIQGTTDQVAITNGNGVSGNPTISLVVASTVEAATGSNNTKIMTPLRSKEAIDSRLASEAEAVAGTNTSKLMTPQRVKQALTGIPKAPDFISQEFTPIARGSRYAVNHGLGSKPNRVQVVLICKVAYLGFSIGDEIDITSLTLDPNSGHGTQTLVNSSQIKFSNYYIYVRDPNDPSIFGWAEATSTYANNWAIVLRAWR